MARLLGISRSRLGGLVTRITGLNQLAKLQADIRNISAFSAWQELLRGEKYSDPRVLSRYGFKVHSQAEEDGIIHEIFRRIGPIKKTFMEIGVSNGQENNTLYLLRQGWTGVWIDGNQKYTDHIHHTFEKFISRGALHCRCEHVTRDNINELYEQFYPEHGPDLLSVDIDGNDYHILAAIKALDARVVVVEYNPVFAPPIEWVMDYTPNYEWAGNDTYSASLKSYETLLLEKNYLLVGCTSNGNNAFFVRKDLAKDHFHQNCSAEFHYEPQRFWITNAFMGGHRYSIG